jgi:hypothetical protein
MKWLRHAGFDSADSDFNDDTSIKHGLDQLKLVYDHKVQYVTFEFSLTPALVKRIPAACEYDTAGFMYGCNADARYGNNLHVSRVEGDTSTHAIFLTNITPGVLIVILSPHHLRNPGRHCTSTGPRWREGIHTRFSA